MSVVQQYTNDQSIPTTHHGGGDASQAGANASEGMTEEIIQKVNTRSDWFFLKKTIFFATFLVTRQSISFDTIT